MRIFYLLLAIVSMIYYDTLHRSVCIDICDTLVKSANMCFIGSLKVFVSITVTGLLKVLVSINYYDSLSLSAII